MNAQRAIEIIGCFGGDAARWPAAEREAVAALAREAPAVAAALAAARELDELLGVWASDVCPRDFDAGLLRGPAAGSWRPARGWLAGAVMAAAVATGFAVLAPAPTAIPAAVAARSAGVPPAPGRESDTEAFATLFTPTADEDELI